MIVEKTHPAAALAEDGADERRAILPAAGRICVDKGVERGLPADAGMGMKLEFDVHAHILKTLLNPQNRGWRRRGMNRAYISLDHDELGQDNKLLAE